MFHPHYLTSTTVMIRSWFSFLLPVLFHSSASHSHLISATTFTCVPSPDIYPLCPLSLGQIIAKHSLLLTYSRPSSACLPASVRPSVRPSCLPVCPVCLEVLHSSLPFPAPHLSTPCLPAVSVLSAWRSFILPCHSLFLTLNPVLALPTPASFVCIWVPLPPRLWQSTIIDWFNFCISS